MVLILQGSASLVSACLNVMYGMILELSDGAAAEFQTTFRPRLQELFFYSKASLHASVCILALLCDLGR